MQRFHRRVDAPARILGGPSSNSKSKSSRRPRLIPLSHNLQLPTNKLPTTVIVKWSIFSQFYLQKWSNGSILHYDVQDGIRFFIWKLFCLAIVSVWQLLVFLMIRFHSVANLINYFYITMHVVIKVQQWRNKQFMYSTQTSVDPNNDTFISTLT